MKIETAGSSKMYILVYQTTRHRIEKDCN